MNKLFVRNKWLSMLALVLVFSFIVPIVSNVFTVEVNAQEIELYRNGFEENSSGWEVYFGGTKNVQRKRRQAVCIR